MGSRSTGLALQRWRLLDGQASCEGGQLQPGTVTLPEGPEWGPFFRLYAPCIAVMQVRTDEKKPACGGLFSLMAGR